MGCIIIGSVHMWMEVTFPAVVQCHTGCAKLYKKYSLGKKALQKYCVHFLAAGHDELESSRLSQTLLEGASYYPIYIFYFGILMLYLTDI